MKHSLVLILLATASLTACNSGGICNPDTSSKAHAQTPPASGNPLVESGSAQNNNPTAPILSAPAANESDTTPSLNPVIVTKPAESVIANNNNPSSESSTTQKNNPPAVNSYQYPESCVPVESVPQPLGPNYMYAKCKNDQGVTPDGYSSLNLDLCAPGSAILNNNGMLVCAQYRDDIPKGSYLLHCRIDALKLHASYNGSSIKMGELSASCHDSFGNMISTYFSYSTLHLHNNTVSFKNGALNFDKQ